MEFDYNEYDSLSVLIKRKESSAILSYYNSFGWEEYERRDDRRYFDIIHIKLKRRHKIPNKDRLQLLEIEMENAINRLAVLRGKKHWRTVAFAVLLSILSLFIAAIGVSLVLYKLSPLGVSLIALAVLPSFFALPLLRKNFDSENKAYASKFKETTATIGRIIAKAERLIENG